MTFSVQALQGDQLEGGLHGFIIQSTVPVLADTTLFVLLSFPGVNPADLTDFASVPNAVMIPAGQTSVTFYLQSLNDGLTEADESFAVEIGGVDPALIAGGPAGGTILAANPAQVIDYRVGQGLNSGDLQNLTIDVVGNSVTEALLDPATGNLTYVNKSVSGVISPVRTAVPYGLADDFNILVDVGGGGAAASGASAQIITADGNDTITVRAADTVSTVI